MDFTTLPHKLLQPENFEKEVSNLRKRFMDRQSPDYVFRPVYHKRIPADGFAPYMSNIWVGMFSLALQFSILIRVRPVLAAASFAKQGSRPSNTARAPRPVPLRRDRSSSLCSLHRSRVRLPETYRWGQDCGKLRFFDDRTSHRRLGCIRYKCIPLSRRGLSAQTS